MELTVRVFSCFKSGSVHFTQVGLGLMILSLPSALVIGVGCHAQLRLFLNDSLGDLRIMSSVAWFRLPYLEATCWDAGQVPRLSGILASF